MPWGDPDRIRPLVCSILAAMLALTWQALTVRYNYDGNWTGLFCTGANFVTPPSLAGEQIYRLPNSYGYDGQFYHYVAHDPLLRHGLDHYVDAPRLRYRRILVPALAYLGAAGQSAYIDAACIAVNLLFLLAGVYWMSRYVGGYGLHPACGLLFLLVPAVVVSLDRMTIDLALAALCMGFALYVIEDRPRETFVILVLAALARETGLLLIAAYCLAEFSERRFRRGVLFATSALPALGWSLFVRSRTINYNTTSWFTPVPLAGLVTKMFHPVHYTVMAAAAYTALDELALAGVVLAFLASFWQMRPKWARPLQFAVLLLALGSLNLGEPFWMDAYDFGRVLSPLLLLLALFACSSRSWIVLLPLAMVVPRVGLQMSAQVVKVARGLFG